ncbi:MAG TPA: hypothetical protein ENI85_13730 [Deltaproteobacteria bacterium]|nr:hypothetical protein [Deltaproteobacteria bacterium]
MKKALLVIAGFTVISIGLTWLWNEWLRLAYAHLLNLVAPPVYDLIGFEGARVGAFRQRYVNFVPFVSLVLVTPGLGLRRRGLGLGLGVFTIFISHLALNLTERLQPGQSLPLVSSLVSDAFPFVVWLIVAHPVVSGFFTGPGPEGGATTHAGADPDTPADP